MLYEKVGLLHLRKLSTHVSQRSLRRLTWAETFRYLLIFWVSKDNYISRFRQVLDEIDCLWIHN